MHRTSILLTIFVQCCICGCWSRIAENTCSLNVDYGLMKSKQPLMVVSDGKDYSLLSPEKIEKDSVIKVSSDSKVTLVCPGLNNKLKSTQKDTVVTTCQKNQLQTGTGRNIIKGTSKFSCMQEITPLIRNTGEKCDENSQATAYEIGYSAEEINSWISMLIVCHDAANMNTLYSVNTINGKSVEARQKNVPRTSDFKAGNLPELFEAGSPNKYYIGKSQVQKFRDLFKTKNLNNYINLYERKYLSRGHLTPDADMALQSWKLATYMYINVAPQWQNINGGNWLKVENKVRDAAISSKDIFTIITGTYGVMKLRIGQIEKEVYLAPNNKLRVPEQFWKIVYHKKSKSAIVLITSNNPYMRVQPLCNDICNNFNWSHETFQGEENIGKGLTYCCTYKDFQQVISYVPPLTVEGTYAMPKSNDNVSSKKSLLPRFRSAVKNVIKNNGKGMWKWREKAKQN